MQRPRPPQGRRVWQSPPLLLLLLLLLVLLPPAAHAFAFLAPTGHRAPFLPPPPSHSRRKPGLVVVAVAPPAGGGDGSSSGVLNRPPQAAAAAIKPPQPLPPLPMVYLPATLTSLTGSKSKTNKKPKQGGNEEDEAILIPREVAELCGHEMLVLRRQLRAGPARVVAEACSVSITGCGSVALAGGDDVYVDARESVVPTGRRGSVTCPLVWEGRHLGAITVKLRGLRGETAPAPRLLGPRESLLLQASARRIARALEEHPGIRLAEQARRKVTQKPKAQGLSYHNHDKSSSNTRAAKRLLRRSRSSRSPSTPTPTASSAAAAAGATRGMRPHAHTIHVHHAAAVIRYITAVLTPLLARLPPLPRLSPVVEPTLQRLRLDALIWRLALPAMALLALDPAMHCIDTAYLSRRLGPTGLAAFALGERAVSLASYLFAAALSTPITPFVARLRAEGSARVAYALVVRRLGLACALLGVGLIPILNAAGIPLLRMLGVGNEALAPALEYYRIRVAGMPAILLNALAVGVFRGFMDTATPLVVAVVGFGLGYYLQPQWLPWPLNQVVAPGNELAGFGLTAVIAQYASLLLFLLRLPAIRPARPPGYRRRRPLLQPMLTLLGQGLSLAARSVLFRLLLLALSSAEVARVGGAVELAAHQVALQLLLLPSSVLFDALAISGQALVADCLGRHALARAAKVGRILLSYGLSFGAALSLHHLVAGVPAFITQDPAVLAKTRPLTLILAVLMPLTGYVQVCAGLLQGAQDYAYQIKLMVAAVLSALPILRLLAHHQGLVGVWLSLVFVQGVRAIGLSHRLWKDGRSPLTLRREGGWASLEEKGLRDRLRALPGQVAAAWGVVWGEVSVWVDGEERTRRKEQRERALAAAAAQEARPFLPMAF